MAEIGYDISRASQLLRDGKLVAIPTETVYGLAANAFDSRAVAGIFEAKGRPHFDPLIVHLHDRKQLSKVCQSVSELFDKLYAAFSPGPITYILPKSDVVPDLVTSGNSTVGVRFPRHPLSRELLFESGLALAAPSANPFGYISPTTAMHVNDQLGELIPYILDGGPCEVGVESTIIDLSQEQPVILRLGGLAKEEIEEVIGPVEVKTSSSNPTAPGMLSSHYSPSKRLVLGDIEMLIAQEDPKRVGTISLSTSYPDIPAGNQKILSPTADLKQAAAGLFSALRELDQSDVDIIFAEKFPNEGLGRAINDRLKRAAHR